jgi:hypothetical protein
MSASAMSDYDWRRAVVVRRVKALFSALGECEAALEALADSDELGPIVADAFVEVLGRPAVEDTKWVGTGLRSYRQYFQSKGGDR